MYSCQYFLDANKEPTKKEISGSEDMTYWRKPLAAQSEDPCLITETHTWRREMTLTIFSLPSISVVCVSNQQINVKKIKITEQIRN